MSEWIKIDAEVLEDLQSVLGVTDDIGRAAVAEAAAYWAGTFYAMSPEEIKGKLRVEATPSGGTGYLVSVSMSGGEVPAFDLPKRGVATFISSEKIGETTKPTVLTKSGEQGLFLSKISRMGRPSIEKYAERLAISQGVLVSEMTEDMLIASVASKIENIYESKGVKVDMRTPGGRLRAPAGGFTDPISGKFYRGGTYVSGVG